MRTTALGPGGAVVVRGGVAHTYGNPTGEPSTYLLVMTRRIHALIRALIFLELRDESTIAAVFEDRPSSFRGGPSPQAGRPSRPESSIPPSKGRPPPPRCTSSARDAGQG